MIADEGLCVVSVTLVGDDLIHLQPYFPVVDSTCHTSQAAPQLVTLEALFAYCFSCCFPKKLSHFLSPQVLDTLHPTKYIIAPPPCTTKGGIDFVYVTYVYLFYFHLFYLALIYRPFTDPRPQAYTHTLTRAAHKKRAKKNPARMSGVDGLAFHRLLAFLQLRGDGRVDGRQFLGRHLLDAASLVLLVRRWRFQAE